MKLEPRLYQTECVKAIYKYFENNTGNPICALPTGTGKAVIIAMFLESIFKSFPNQKILIVTHVKELVAQNHDKLKAIWPTAPAGINSAGLRRRDSRHNIIFAGIASVYKTWKDFSKVDLIIIDEAHLVSPNDETMYGKLIANLKSVNPYIKVIGFTATPWRLGQGKITDNGIFTDICFDMTSLEAFNWLVAQNYLCRLVPRRMKTQIDTDSLHIRAGDFIQSELQHAVDKETVTNAALLETIELAEDRKHWLVFATGIQHAEHISEALCVLGIEARVVHSKLSIPERDSVIKAFRNGHIRAIVNVGVLTTGFDFPEIDLIVMLRPTASAVLWVQMIGRGTRVAEGKENCMILDFSGNTKRLGPINDPVLPKAKGTKGGEAPIKCCDSCGTYAHPSVKICEFCGAEFKFAVKITHKASTADLVREDLPVVKTYKIDHVTYSKHEKIGKPPSLKVSYYSGLNTFSEFVCFEHEGFARRKAVQWWQQRMNKSHNLPCADTIDYAMAVINTLLTPTHMNVWLKKPYPEILSFCFDGTAFGKETENSQKTIDTSNQCDNISS